MEKENIKEVITDERVTDFVKGINQLCADTGLEVFSFDLSCAIIQTPEGTFYTLEKVNKDEEYFSRQLWD